MDRDSVYYMRIEIHSGGHFVDENAYIGGKISVLEQWDWFGWTFDDLFNSITRSGQSIKQYAFRVKNTNRFVFFDDERTFSNKIYECVDWENDQITVYVEFSGDSNVDGGCVDGLYMENDVGEKGGSHEEILDIRCHTEQQEGDDVNDEVMDSDEDTDSYDDTIEKGSTSDIEDTDDGLEDGDFSSEDEFLEARKKMNEMRENAKQVQNVRQEIGESSNSVFSTFVGGDDELVCQYSAEPLDSDEDVEPFQLKDTSLDYDKDCDHKKIKFMIGMRFKDVNECKEAVKLWAILKGFNIRWTKSVKDKIQAKCEKSCPWVLYASKLKHEPTCVIKTYVGNHECLRPVRHRQVTAAWISKIFMELLKTNPSMKAQEIKSILKKKYKVVVERMMCYRAKNRALEQLRGTLESHYSKLIPYLTELQTKDKEGKFLAKTYLDSEGRCVFQRVYIGFSALRKGFFVGCKRFIGFDGCFLKTQLGGTLLAAVSKDCNQKMYPIAWAVVEKETQDTWKWFMELLFEDLGILDGFGWTFMSDKQKGLINAVRILAPNAEHRHCARHIFVNWRKKHGGEKFKGLFWNLVYCTSQAEYNYHMNLLRMESNGAAEDFESQNPKSFCKSLIMSFNKVDTVDNNICETFNSYILKFRDSPLIDMLEGIRLTIMTRMYELHKIAESENGVLCKKIRKTLEKSMSLITDCDLQPASVGKYEVHLSDGSHIVDLNERSCTCRSWELTGLPCYHVLACIVHSRDDYVNYVDHFYYNSTWKECYKFALEPIRGEKDWPRVDHAPVYPPKFVKQPGRPKKKRKRGLDEIRPGLEGKLTKRGVQMSCRNCGGTDHNRRTCTAEPPTQNTSVQPRPRGRPRVRSPNGASRPRGRPRGRPSNVQNASGQEHASTSTSRSTINSRGVIARELNMARHGFGRLVGESGNIYVTTGRTVHFSRPTTSDGHATH